MEKPRRRYSSESRFKDFTLHAPKRNDSAPHPTNSGSSKPVDPRRDPHRVSFPLKPSFRIPKKNDSSSLKSQEDNARNRSTSWGSRWENRATTQHGSSRRSCPPEEWRDSTRYPREGVKKGRMERSERDGKRELTRGPDWASRKRTVHHRTMGGFAEAKRRRVSESSSGEEGRVGSMSVRARLAQDRDKVFQLGSKQPTEVATVPSPLSGSPPSSCAQGGTAEAPSSPEPPPPGVTLSPDHSVKSKRGKPCKDTVISEIDTVSSAEQQEKQKKEAQPVVILSDYSSDEAPVVPSPWPALSHPVPISCSELKAEETSTNPVTEAHANPTREELPVPSTTPTPTVDVEDNDHVPEASSHLTRDKDNSNNSVKPPVELSSDIVAQITPKECGVDDNCCHHKDWAGKRCCNLALEGKRLCKCHYSDTLKLQEALGLLISSKPSQDSLDSGKNAPQAALASLETQPVSPVTDHAPAEMEPISLVTENQPTVKVEPHSPPKIQPPQHLESVTVLQQKVEQTVKVEPHSPPKIQPPQHLESVTVLRQEKVEQTVKAEPRSPPKIQPPQHLESVTVLRQEKVEQTVRAPPTELMQQTTGDVQIKTSTLQQSSESVGKSGYVDQNGVSQLDKLNAKEQDVMAHLVVLRKKRLAKEKEIAMLLEQVEEIKQEIQQASTEWTRVNEAKRLLVLGEVSAVQETSSSEQQLQQDGSETQDAHTTGSPVPTGLTTPSVQSPQQPVTALQPATSLTPVPHTMVKATWRLFQPPHSDSVLDVKMVKNVLITTSRDRTTHLYDTSSGSILARYENHTKAVTCLDVTEGIFATGSNDGFILVYSIERSPQPLRFTAASKVMCLKMIGSVILVGLDNGKVEIFKMTSQSPLWSVRCYEQDRPITAIEANGQYVVVGTTLERNPIMYWRLQDFLPTAGAPLYTRNHCLSAMGGNILSLQLRGESTLFSSTSQGHVLIHNLSNGSLVHCFQAASSAIPCAHVTDGGHLFISTMNNTIRCFRLKDYRMQGALQMSNPVYRLAVQHNHLYYGDNQGNVGAICTDKIIL